MFKKITNIKIKGGIFKESTNLNLFDNEKNVIIYGKNGSGKTTISRGFRKIKGFQEESVEIFELLNKGDEVIQISEEKKEYIQVFNEDFIEDNIKINKEGLESIVVMGPLKEVDDQLNQLKEELKPKLEEIKKENENLEKYKNKKNNLSPDFYLDEINKCLRTKGGWAERDSKIRGNKSNTSVNNETYKNFIDLKPSKLHNELVIEYDEMMKKLKIIRSGETKIDAKLPVLSELEYEDEKIKNLLSKKIENPELSEREKKILEISKQEKISETLDDIKEYFSERERTICPYCFQPVGKDYIKELSNHIEKILNIEVQEHKSELDTLKSKLLPIEIDFSKFTKLSDEKIKECEENLIKYNSTIEEIKGYIEKKQKNLYIPIQNTNFEIDSKYNNCKDSLKKLEESIKEFNSNISNEDIVKENLINLNNQIAHYEIFYMNQQREKQENEKAEIQKKLENLAVEEEGLKSKIDSLKEQKKNIKIAMESINNDLKYIFFFKG